jgi:plasmid stabilization system protein ParE
MIRAARRLEPAGSQDVLRLYRFLEPKNRDAARRAMRSIRRGVRILARHPEIGRPAGNIEPRFREWVVRFGDGAYVALYHYAGRPVLILAERLAREAGYSTP